MGFFDFIGDAVGAISGAIAPEVPLLSAGLGFLGQQGTNQSNQAMAGATNATSIELANTAMQRKVTDLKAAGLNPMLAYSQGGSPVPQLQTARNENPVAAGAANQLLTAQISATNAQAQASSAQAVAAKAQALKTQSETPPDVVRQNPLNTQADFISEQITKMGYDNALTRSQRELVDREIQNGILTGDKIKAETGSIAVDNALKAAETIRTKAETPRISATSEAYTTAQEGAHKVGSMLGNSAEAAGKITNDISQGLYNAKSNMQMLPPRVQLQRNQK